MAFQQLQMPLFFSLQTALLPWQVNRCLSIKGAEDVLNRPHAFEISTIENNMFFIADSDKVSVAGRNRYAA